MKKISTTSSVCHSPEKLNAATHSQSCDIISSQRLRIPLLKVDSNVSFKLEKKLIENYIFMTLDPVLTLETDKQIDIFIQGIVTVP